MKKRSRKAEPKGLAITWEQEVSVLKAARSLQGSGPAFLVDGCATGPSQENRGEGGLGRQHNEFMLREARGT